MGTQRQPTRLSTIAARVLLLIALLFVAAPRPAPAQPSEAFLQYRDTHLSDIPPPASCQRDRAKPEQPRVLRIRDLRQPPPLFDLPLVFAVNDGVHALAISPFGFLLLPILGAMYGAAVSFGLSGSSSFREPSDSIVPFFFAVLGALAALGVFARAYHWEVMMDLPLGRLCPFESLRSPPVTNLLTDIVCSLVFYVVLSPLLALLKLAIAIALLVCLPLALWGAPFALVALVRGLHYLFVLHPAEKPLAPARHGYHIDEKALTATLRQPIDLDHPPPAWRSQQDAHKLRALQEQLRRATEVVLAAEAYERARAAAADAKRRHREARRRNRKSWIRKWWKGWFA